MSSAPVDGISTGPADLPPSLAALVGGPGADELGLFEDDGDGSGLSGSDEEFQQDASLIDAPAGARSMIGEADQGVPPAECKRHCEFAWQDSMCQLFTLICTDV